MTEGQVLGTAIAQEMKREGTTAGFGEFGRDIHLSLIALIFLWVIEPKFCLVTWCAEEKDSFQINFRFLKFLF